MGLGSSIHLSTLALQQRLGVKWVYIPTKGGQSSVLSVMTGDGDFLFMGVIQTWVHVKSGKLKLLAVSSEQREPMFPLATEKERWAKVVKASGYKIE